MPLSFRNASIRLTTMPIPLREKATRLAALIEIPPDVSYENEAASLAAFADAFAARYRQRRKAGELMGPFSTPWLPIRFAPVLRWTEQAGHRCCWEPGGVFSGGEKRT